MIFNECIYLRYRWKNSSIFNGILPTSAIFAVSTAIKEISQSETIWIGQDSKRSLTISLPLCRNGIKKPASTSPEESPY
jgi:hypothetical protein